VQLSNAFDDVAGFILLVVRRIDRDRCTIAAVGPIAPLTRLTRSPAVRTNAAQGLLGTRRAV